MAPQVTTTTSDSFVFWTQVQRILRWAKIGLAVVATLFVLILVAEAVRLYQLATGLHPLLGLAWALILVVGAVLLGLPAYRLLRVPRVVRPPPIPAASDLRASHLRAEARFLERYLENCAANPAFRGQLDAIDKARGELRGLAAEYRDVADDRLKESADRLNAWAAGSMDAILAEVDARADQIIYREALTVGVGTAASPNGSLDAFVMLWRSLNLTSRLAVLYYGRPGVLGLLAICRDVVVATAAAAYLQSVTDSLGALIARSLGGFAGVLSGPAVEGTTNALVLIRIGYISKERCRSLRKWDTATQRSAVLRSLDATRRVAFGLTTEILRQAGTGIGVAAGAMATGIGRASQGVAAAAGSAKNVATGLGQRLGSVFKKPPPEERSEKSDEGEGAS